MAKALIYRPEKSAMQSGKGKTRAWVLRFKPEKPYFVENLMGWVGMSDMPQEVQLTFPSREAAVSYAKQQNLPFDVVEPHNRALRVQAYADNFKFNRPQE
ncbi:MAG: ETC complex I subunit [Proteobacteria bacterium]|nr:ETC complex I subunit [Pseudomonadota bacterium]